MVLYRSSLFFVLLPGVAMYATDPITDATKALGLPNTEMLFYKAAEDAGFTDPHNVAAHRYNQWWNDGYKALPRYIKDFCARTLNRLSATEFTNKVII